MKLFPLFPTQVIAHDLENYSDYRNELIRYCYQDQKDSDGVKISNMGGWQSEHKQIDLLSGVYEELSTSLSTYLSTQFAFSMPWVNINPPRTSNERHTHPGSDLSVVMYVKVPENSGSIEMTNPAYIESFNLLSSIKPEANLTPSIAITPMEGRVLIFPSNILHRVLENKSDDNRTSISWNIKIL